MKKVQKIINMFCWVPFVWSFIGYYFMDGGVNGETLSVWEAIYASVALYFVNPVSDNQNILILMGKFFSLVVTTSVLLSILSFFMGSISRWWIRRWKDSTAVYTDCELGAALCNGCRHGYLIEIEEKKQLKFENTKNHFLVFSDDKMALGLLTAQPRLASMNQIYVLLNEVDTGLLSTEFENIHYFNINDILAREYWKKNNLYNEINNAYLDKTYKVGIIGYDALGKSIFKQAYLSNLYNLKQSIEYHIWGADAYEQSFLQSLESGNDDVIIVHKGDWSEDIDEIRDLSSVIVTYENDIHVIQTLISANPLLNIWAFSSSGDNFLKIFESDTIHSFGDVSSILNEKTIKSEQTYKMAKLFNYDYFLNVNKLELPAGFEREMNEQWEKLSGFKRNSSIARADFYWIEDRKRREGTPEEEIWKMEHIRWCRFHYINHWSYGSKKSDKTKTHPLLVDFDALPTAEKEKDGISNPEIKKMIENLI